MSFKGNGKKKTSIGNSPRTNFKKNKNRSTRKKSRGQGKPR